MLNTSLARFLLSFFFLLFLFVFSLLDDGYRLTYLGYDYLALRALVQRGLISGLGRRIGVGKEADIYECTNENGDALVLKVHR